MLASHACQESIGARNIRWCLLVGSSGRNIGRDLPIPHGAPLRLRVERQIGYKSLKFLRRIVVADRFNDFGKTGSIQNGWAWHVGI